MTRARRRRFGSVRRLNRHGRDYLEASYPTPQDAFARWPGLPRRQSRMLPAEYAAELDAWLADAEKRISFGEWTPPQVERAKRERDGVTFAEYARAWAGGGEGPTATCPADAAERLTSLEGRRIGSRRDRIMILTLAFTGMRDGELAALRVGDVHYRTRRIHITRTVTPLRGTVTAKAPRRTANHARCPSPDS